MSSGFGIPSAPGFGVAASPGFGNPGASPAFGAPSAIGAASLPQPFGGGASGGGFAAMAAKVWHACIHAQEKLATTAAILSGPSSMCRQLVGQCILLSLSVLTVILSI